MTNTIEIDLNDYLTYDDRKEMARDVFRAACARQTQADFERIISNSAYFLVADLVNQHFSGEMVEILKAKTIHVIENLSSHTVFYPPSAWDRAASKGFEHLQTLLDEQKPLIADRLKTVIANYNSDDLREMVERQVGQAIINKLTGE